MSLRASVTSTSVLETAFHNVFARRAEVRDVEPIGARFRLVTLAGEDLVRRAWTPGDMVQVAFGGWEARAYTPFDYVAREGAITFLGHVHGHGVGSAWLAAPALGEPLFMVGPRMAVNLTTVRRPAVFFGDETSFSTAAAMRATAGGLRDVAFHFEVEDVEASRTALDRIGVNERSGAAGVTLTTRTELDRHLDAVEAHVVAAFHAAPDAHAVFTGKASSIQRLYKALRRAGVRGKQVTNVAYWAPGRKGFSGLQK